MALSRRARVLALCLAIGTVGVATVARANGRFPRAQRLLERSDAADELVLAATYGLLLTEDRGGEWRHVCELGFAFAVDEIDPLVGVFSDGSMLVKGTRSLNHARPPFCAFEPVLGGPASEVATDFSLDATDGNRAVALVQLRGADGATVNQVFESIDAGRTFTELGEPLPGEDVVTGLTLDIAPSDANRIYVSATGRGAAAFARSDDRGATWTTAPLALGAEEYPYIAAVDPTNADAIYVRTDQWVSNAEGIVEANDALLYSDDGGLAFRELHRAGGKLFGFALSPDGREILIGYGDPVEPSRFVDEAVLGIYRASTLDFVFTKIYEGSVSCLAWTENGLYVCTSQDAVGFALGFAPNADFELATENPLTPLLDLRDVRGPLDCPACTSGADCLALWPETCATFESCDASVVVAGSSSTDCPDAGSGGAGQGGAATGGEAGASKKTGPPVSDSSCGCRSATSGSGAGSFLLVMLGALSLQRRRRARRERLDR